MSFNFTMPVTVLSGRNVVRNHVDKFMLGSSCLIVCGRRSAKICGALDDVKEVLNALDIRYKIYNWITENPPVSVCYEGGHAARECEAEFVIGIGGGSALDASKAIAAYAANPEMEPMEIYTKKIRRMLPIIAIPTTAGTGSEVNPYSVMTLDGLNVKKTFKSPLSYPKYAMLDPTYTETLGTVYTVSTALDAFCHCAESYLSPKSTEISRMFAAMGARKIYEVLKKIAALDGDEEARMEALKPYREALLTGACAGGIAINTTGTGFNHPLGYNLTLYRGIPHGRACGAFMGEYFAYNSREAEGKALIDEFCAALGESADTVADRIVSWSNVTEKLDADEIALYVDNVKGAGNYANSPYVINPEQMADIYRKLFS